MSNILDSLHTVQLGKQSAVGTSVAATWQTRLMMEFSSDGGVVETPQAATGQLMANAGGVRQAIERSVPFTIPAAACTTEDIMMALHMAIEDGPATAEVDATDVLSSATFNRARTTIPSVKGMTIEDRDSTGAAHITNQYADAFLTQFQLSFTKGGFTQFGASGLANGRTTEASFADLSANFPMSNVGYIPAQGWTMWLDDDAGSYGTTQFALDVLSMTHTFDTGLVAQRPANGSIDLTYPTIELNGSVPKATLELVCLAQVGSGLYAAERTKAEAQALRAVRMRGIGTAAVGGTTARRLEFEFPCRHVQDTYICDGEDEGQRVITLKLESHPDFDVADWYQFVTYSSQLDTDPA